MWSLPPKVRRLLLGINKRGCKKDLRKTLLGFAIKSQRMISFPSVDNSRQADQYSVDAFESLPSSRIDVFSFNVTFVSSRCSSHLPKVTKSVISKSRPDCAADASSAIFIDVRFFPLRRRYCLCTSIFDFPPAFLSMYKTAASELYQ